DDDNGNVDGGKEIDGHSNENDGADDRDHQTSDDNEEGMFDGEAGHYLFASGVVEGCTSFGCTRSPGRNWLRLPMTTRSPSLTPERISTCALSSRPSFTCFSMISLCEPKVSTAASLPLRETASNGTVRAFSFPLKARFVSEYMPGSNWPLELSKS